MAVFSLTGNDTLILSDRVMKDFADNSTVELSFENDLVGISTGKNGNTVYADNRQGGNGTITLRLIRGSKDDRWLNGMLVQQDRDLPTFKVFNGSFTKRIGDGLGNVRFDNYVMQGGVFRKGVDAQENLNGETESAVSIYTLFFAKITRAIG